MAPKFAVKNGGPYTEGSKFPKTKMHTGFAGKQTRLGVAGRLIKRARRHIIKQAQRRKKKSSSYRPPWTELPPEITANILHRLGAVEILNTAQKVCRTWRSVCKDPAMWRVIDMRSHGDLNDMEDLVKMCRHAVDRSQGQLVDINLDYFVSDELLDYIAERYGTLKRFQLVSSYELCDEGLIKAVKRFPKLEELVIICISYCDETIETIGRSCPLLRSFAYNNRAYITNEFCYIGDEDAFAIARSMPELRHLQLMGNGLTNEGLKAILDGCPHLESLDLRRCFHVKLTGDVEKRCSMQGIKRLRYPDEPTSDYEFRLDDSDYNGPDISDSEFWFL